MIPLYTELWEWLGAGPHILIRWCFFLCPWTKLYRFSTKNHHEKHQEWLFEFLCKSFLQNLSSRLAHRLNFHFNNFNDKSRNLAYFLCPYMLESLKSPNFNYIKLMINNSTSFMKTPLHLILVWISCPTCTKFTVMYVYRMFYVIRQKTCLKMDRGNEQCVFSAAAI